MHMGRMVSSGGVNVSVFDTAQVCVFVYVFERLPDTMSNTIMPTLQSIHSASHIVLKPI